MNTVQDILDYLTRNNKCRLGSTIIQAIATFYKVTSFVDNHETVKYLSKQELEQFLTAKGV